MCREPSCKNPKRVYCYLLMPSENFVIYAEIFYFSGKLIKEFRKTYRLRSNAFLFGGVKDLICLTTMFSGSKEISKSYKTQYQIKNVTNKYQHSPFLIFYKNFIQSQKFFFVELFTVSQRYPRSNFGHFSYLLTSSLNGNSSSQGIFYLPLGFIEVIEVAMFLGGLLG